ncbi:VOC family protein [Streptomyces sp. N2-109]|uniref:VOC family protein n=1 Tax=Streptomyces gossypii TaxID=2883101 RepID=A0ABT2JSD2_9ACTN|nr:VOC family protein [Streptomyces gossypii]MCT2590792.1 VOC family protein [Streptomyces gossypii]
MSKMIFVNLPVRDLTRSREFFGKLGFTFNEQFSDDNAASLVIDADNGIYAMLLTEPFFKTFTTKEVADAATTAEVIVALGVESRQEVDDLADKALAAGGKSSKDPMDEGFMYGRSFQDLDGHLWEVMWMDPAAVQDPAAS